MNVQAKLWYRATFLVLRLITYVAVTHLLTCQLF